MISALDHFLLKVGYVPCRPSAAGERQQLAGLRPSQRPDITCGSPDLVIRLPVVFDSFVLSDVVGILLPVLRPIDFPHLRVFPMPGKPGIDEPCPRQASLNDRRRGDARRAMRSAHGERPPGVSLPEGDRRVAGSGIRSRNCACQQQQQCDWFRMPKTSASSYFLMSKKKAPRQSSVNSPDRKPKLPQRW